MEYKTQDGDRRISTDRLRANNLRSKRIHTSASVTRAWSSNNHRRLNLQAKKERANNRKR